MNGWKRGGAVAAEQKASLREIGIETLTSAETHVIPAIPLIGHIPSFSILFLNPFDVFNDIFSVLFKLLLG